MERPAEIKARQERRSVPVARAALTTLLVLGATLPLRAATYLPMPDAELAARTPVIVRVRAGESVGRLEAPGRGPGIVTVTDLTVLEVIQGSVPTAAIRIVLPGGAVEGQALWIPGRPTFTDGQEAILFLAPIPRRPGEYGTTEFGLSVFDVLEDPAGHRFAARTLFQAGVEEILSPSGNGPAEPDHVRDLSSFLAALRVAGEGTPMPEVQRAAPAGPLQLPVAMSGGMRALWVNIGGAEGSGNQYKWFWSSGSGCSSPNGKVYPVGTQSSLNDGTDGLTHVQNAVAQWAGVSGADVRYSYSATAPNVTVNLDVDDDPSSGWSGPITTCPPSGIIGVAGPSANCLGTFSGQPFYSCNSGSAWMRHIACTYDAGVFRSGVLHEIGHTLGLGHPDEGVSSFSVTAPSDWNSAVMRSAIPPGQPDSPQADDVAAIQFYYGAEPPPPAPVANFAFSPASPVIAQTVSFTDTSTNTPTSWSWTFGDGGTSISRYPTHAYGSAGTFDVTLTATNAGGSDSKTKQVVVAVPAVPVASFIVSPSSPTAGQPVSFLDTSANMPTSWAWTFGDGETSTQQDPGHVYASAGTYTVTLTAANAGGSDSDSTEVVVSQPVPPAADFSFTPLSPVAGQQVSFFDQSTGGPISWFWTFGDGTSSTSANPVKTYVSAGSYTVTLEVSNTSGSNGTMRQVTVSAAGVAPVASFIFAPASPTAGQTVQFTDTSASGPTAWSWDFGDGTFSALQNPTKVYVGVATLTVRLTAINAFGSSTTTKQVVVSSSNRAPTAVADAYASASGTPLSVSAPGVLANDSDPDGDPLVAALVTGPASGSLVLQPNGAFTYTPAAGFAGTVTFVYRVSDGRGGLSGPVTVTVTITVTPSESERVVPIVLDAFGVGSSRFRSEMVLANRGTTTANVELTYTAATSLSGRGSGTVNETLGAGRQLVLDDALAYFRSKGLLIPQAVVGASQGGTVRVRFRNLSSPDAGAAFARTTALLPEGRAGVAYPAVDPAEWQTPAGQHIFGLRESTVARSNLALVNLSTTADVGLRVTLQSGTNGDRRTYVLPETIWLQPLQWTQVSAVLAKAGFTNGWAIVERVSGPGPFYAYGVFNDFGTDDGSFIDPIPVSSGVPLRTVPVVLELGIYSTELILTNPTSSTVVVELTYVESLAASGVALRKGTDLLQPHEQKIVEAIPHLRALGVDVGPVGGSYAGSVVARFTLGAQPVSGFAGARTKSPGQPRGSYGVYYSGLGAAEVATSEAWVFSLKQDAESRTNVAVAHAGPGGEPIVLQAEVFDGETGASAGRTGNVTLRAGQWFQWNQLLGSFGLRQGYARIFRVSGASPFLAYGVVNDGGSGRPGTNDGSYVSMLPRR